MFFFTDSGNGPGFGTGVSAAVAVAALGAIVFITLKLWQFI